jgi:hypothetical protein
LPPLATVLDEARIAVGVARQAIDADACAA